MVPPEPSGGGVHTCALRRVDELLGPTPPQDLDEALRLERRLLGGAIPEATDLPQGPPHRPEPASGPRRARRYSACRVRTGPSAQVGPEFGREDPGDGGPDSLVEVAPLLVRPGLGAAVCGDDAEAEIDEQPKRLGVVALAEPRELGYCGVLSLRDTQADVVRVPGLPCHFVRLSLVIGSVRYKLRARP